MAIVEFKKPVKGVDYLSNETSLLEGTVREANNVTIDRDGNFERRKGYTLRVAGSGYHSFYNSKRGWLIVCHKNVINIFDPETYVLTPIASMLESYLTSFTELNGNLYYVNPGASGMFRINETTHRSVGVTLPDTTPQFGASSNGTLHPGSYGVTYTLVDEFGEESPTGPIQVVDLPDGGSIVGTLFSIIPGYMWRIYMTTADGEELYQAEEFEADTVSITIGTHYQGRQPDTFQLQHMPKGLILRNYGSRLFVAAKNAIYYSDPFRPHLFSPTNYLPITGNPFMMEALDTGLFISDITGVSFYQGNDAAQFQVTQVSDERAVYGTSVIIPGEAMSDRFHQYYNVVVWLSQSGYQVGLPTGEVVPLHTKQVGLPNYVQGCSAFFTQEGKKQLVTPVQSNVVSGLNVAIDSSIM